MDVSKRFLSYVAAGLVGVTLFTPRVFAENRLCDFEPKPSDKGLEGNCDANEYMFTHLSDVDEVGKKHKLVFCIGNRHPQNFLPAEWLRGDKTSQLAFDRIAPGRCVSNDFETFEPYVEDPKAYIKYGPAKQFTKQDSTLYIRKPTAGQEVHVADGSLLNSRIAGDRQVEDAIIHVQLEFGTLAEGKTFTYTVVNRGSQAAFFRIPALSQTWNELAKIVGVQNDSNWSLQGDSFLAEPDKDPEKYVVRVAKELPIVEVEVPIQVVTEKNETLAEGRISIYIPQLFKK
jgi:hypothetical protein